MSERSTRCLRTTAHRFFVRSGDLRTLAIARLPQQRNIVSSTSAHHKDERRRYSRDERDLLLLGEIVRAQLASVVAEDQSKGRPERQKVAGILIHLHQSPAQVRASI